MSKNPKRVVAGRKNRSKRKELSSEARQRLSEHAKRNKPWEKSTGPKSLQGKERSAQNARRKAVSPPKPNISELEVQALALLTSMRKLRTSCYTDASAGELRSGADVAESLQRTIVAASTQYSRRLANELLADVI